jgi:hypothetical protein
MIAMYATIAAALIVTGIALGIVLVTSMAVRDEKNAARRLAASGPTSRASGIRAITGLDVRRQEMVS